MAVIEDLRLDIEKSNLKSGQSIKDVEKLETTI